MDSVHDETRFAYALALWDRIEQLSTDRPASLTLVLLVAVVLTLTQRWPDLVMVTALLGWSTSYLPTWQLFALCVLATGLYMVRLRNERSSTVAAPDSVATHDSLSRRPRAASDPERKLERVFEGYLRSLVCGSSSSIEVTYIPCGIPSNGPIAISSSTAGSSPAKMVFKVMSPEFYTRFAHYAHDSEAIFSELAESETIWVDRPDLLTDVFLKKGSPTLQAQGIVDFLCFELIRKLRKRPPVIRNGRAEEGAGTTYRKDIRGFRISSMDAYVLGQDDKQLKRTYQNTILALFLADRLFGGSYLAFKTAALIARVGLCVVTAVFVTDLLD
ncbi:hypothetical protein LIA77_09407 [Sarocladium implicatum]|nr:hypothetical protein LIA77_09407 [Sarocladium implicatum]